MTVLGLFFSIPLAVGATVSPLSALCCEPENGPGGCPDENGSFDNCWDEGGHCCSDGKWYAYEGDGSGGCGDKGLEDSLSCAPSVTVDVTVSPSAVLCCDPEDGPGGCPDENGSFDNCWDEGGYCCGDGNWYAHEVDGSGCCEDKGLDDSQACAAFNVVDATPSLSSAVLCCDPEDRPGGCPDENGSFDNCWDEGGYCCSDGKWYSREGDGSGGCGDKGLEDSLACAPPADATVSPSSTICCDPEDGPGGCPDENGSFDKCWDEGGYCCGDGKWYAHEGDGSGCCKDKGLDDSEACAASVTVNATPSLSSAVLCCDPEDGPGGCPDENGSFDNCWDEGGYCCSDGKWYAHHGDGSGGCGEKRLEDSLPCEVTAPASADPIVCPDGRDAVPKTVCGRGPDRADCSIDEYCFIDPADRFAVCCPSADPTVCPDGRDPVPGTFCGRGPDHADCGIGEYCFIDPADRFTVCCSSAVERPSPNKEESTGTCASDEECTARLRSRSPEQSAIGVKMCQCYAASSVDPFDECEGETDATCNIAKCENTCEGLEGRCLQSLNDNEETKKCLLEPIPVVPTPGVISSAASSSSPCPTSNACFSRSRTQNALVLAITLVVLSL